MRFLTIPDHLARLPVPFRLVLIGVALFCAHLPGPAAAQSSRDIVAAYNVGWRYSIAPGIFIPVDGESVGFSISGDVRYGIEMGPVIVGPGLRIAGYFPSGSTILAGMGTTRLTVPVGPLGPYVLAGVGPGWVSDPSQVGLAWMAGGGLMAHIGPHFGIGAEATYQAITGTAFRALFFGPSLLLAF